MRITLRLPDDVARRLQDRADRHGRPIEQYLLHLIEADAAEADPGSFGPVQTDDEFERLLDELAAGPGFPRLPADFSRADVYDDHD